MSQPNDKDKAFTDYLEKLVQTEDSGALAALRRGLGKPAGTVAEMHRYIVPWLPKDSNPWHDDPYYLVAALFAWHQGNWHLAPDSHSLTNLGASLAHLARQVESESIEKRFVALLNCHRDDLADHLRHAVGLLKSKEIPVDWAQLLRDIKGWDWESRSVQREWARGFWAREEKMEDTKPSTV